MKVTVGAIFCAPVDCVAVAAKYLASAAQFAVRLQVPVPLVMVTKLTEIVQAPVAVMTAAVLALVIADTVNVDW